MAKFGAFPLGIFRDMALKAGYTLFWHVLKGELGTKANNMLVLNKSDSTIFVNIRYLIYFRSNSPFNLKAPRGNAPNFVRHSIIDLPASTSQMGI